jgi:hypothetical protein
MNNQYKQWILLTALIGTIVAIWSLWWWGNQPPFRPKSMPVDSIWIDAPPVPFLRYHGWWFGCWIDSDGHSDRCRLWASGLKNPVVFEGQYVSCENHSPVAANELTLVLPQDSFQMWVGVTSGEIIAPAAFLKNGRYLVPVQAPHGCEELLKKPKNRP